MSNLALNKIKNAPLKVLSNDKVIRIKKMKMLYLFLLPAAAFMAIFNYVPMWGLIIAFKNYRFADGIFRSPWVGFEHFEDLFRTVIFKNVLLNTIEISFVKILLGVFTPLILALMLNEVRNIAFKRISQTISYIPYFFSWIIVASMTMEILSPTRGVVNYIITLLGGEPVAFLMSTKYFRLVLYLQYIWKEVGYGSIIFLAALSAINVELYESANIDGANRFKMMYYITIPGIMPVLTIIFILAWGGILSGGFDQIFNMYNPVVYEVADIIDTYTYRVGIVDADFGYATAVGLFKNIVGVCMVLFGNFIVKRFSEDGGIW